jgi:dihydroflavonol-4-reductase
MDVFMTGANGFVGLNVVSALKAAGHRVTAFVRPGSNVSFLEPFGIRIVRGELGDAASLVAAMEGASAVIHTAGNTSCYMRDLPALLQVNVRGTQNVVNAAIANKVFRIVYTSTTSTIGAFDSATRSADEKTPLDGFRARSPYAITKRMAEETVIAAQERGVECVILNPAEVIGPYDHTLQWGRMVLAVCFNQVPFVPPGGASFCSAVEVGRAHASALTRGRSGERYILAGVNARFAHFLDTTSKVSGKTFDVPDTSYRWLRIKALLQEKLPLLGKPVVEPYRMKVFGGTYYFDCAKAANELQYEPASLEQMLEECAAWYRRNGFMGRQEQPETSQTIDQKEAAWIPER